MDPVTEGEGQCILNEVAVNPLQNQLSGYISQRKKFYLLHTQK